MKSCPWCNNEYPEEFFEEHHLNHIHEDDSEELLKYIEGDGKTTLDVYDRGFHYTKEDITIKKE